MNAALWLTLGLLLGGPAGILLGCIISIGGRG